MGGLQLGRYRFESRDGLIGTAAVQGTVTGGNPATVRPGAKVQVCHTRVPVGAAVTTSDTAGHYSFMGLPSGDLVVTAFPPAGFNSGTVSANVTGLPAGGSRQVDLLLVVPTPLPPGTSITSRETVDGVPVVNWNDAPEPGDNRLPRRDCHLAGPQGGAGHSRIHRDDGGEPLEHLLDHDSGAPAEP